jgi:hypothetical protein
LPPAHRSQSANPFPDDRLEKKSPVRSKDNQIKSIESWLSEDEAIATGLPLFKTYGKKFPQKYLSKTQCKSIKIPVGLNEEPVAYKRNNIRNQYFPLYDRSNAYIWEKPVYTGFDSPDGLTRRRPYGNSAAEPVAYIMRGIGGVFDTLYTKE